MNKFIIDIPEVEPPRNIGSLERDTKEVTVGGYSYTINPLSGEDRMAVYVENRKKAVLVEPKMLGLGWSKELLREAKDCHSGAIETTSSQKILIDQYAEDFNSVYLEIEDEYCKNLQKEILSKYVVDVKGETSEEHRIEKSTAVNLLREIQQFSKIPERYILGL